MATPVRLSWMTATYTAAGCEDLPAHVQEMDGQKLITTTWQLTPEEHAAVSATGLVVLQCVGFQPPVHVGAAQVEQPPEVRLEVMWENGGVEQTMVATAAHEALTLVLNALVCDVEKVTVRRL